MSDPMTTEELDRLQALADAATPGPWSVETLTEPTGTDDGWYNINARGEPAIFEAGKRLEDAALIAAAREALPRLVAEVRALRVLKDKVAVCAETLEDYGNDAEDPFVSGEADYLRAALDAAKEVDRG